MLAALVAVFAVAAVAGTVMGGSSPAERATPAHVHGSTSVAHGKFMSRDHIRFFIQYTTALAKKNKVRPAAGGRQPEGLHRGLQQLPEQGDGDSAGGAPRRHHGARHAAEEPLDAYAAGNYSRSYARTRQAYSHRIVTGDALSAAIVKKFPQRFGS